MKNAFWEAVDKRNNYLSRLTNAVEDKISGLPEGKIYIKHSNGIVRYYFVDGCSEVKEKYLGKNDTELVRQLIQKTYLEKVKNVSKTEIKVIRSMMKEYPLSVAEDIYEQMPDESKGFIHPIVIPDDQFVRRWLDTPYTPKGFSKDTPVFLTNNGEYVKSKSEKIIADKLLDCGIPYKYECPLAVGDNEIFHPDFTILRLSDRKIIYYEHCGKMDDPGYAEDMVARAKKFSLAGIVQGDRLFYTFETGKCPLDVRVLENMIDTNFR